MILTSVEHIAKTWWLVVNDIIAKGYDTSGGKFSKISGRMIEGDEWRKVTGLDFPGKNLDHLIITKTCYFCWF